ncbi:diguanylate cyclase [Marinobacterium sp. YM272]|uniref:diguanylate cyclase n=1 Tax=Marinobacterium sp. YM272 TaxID=3421654 RepID=UPI003D7F80D0
MTNRFPNLYQKPRRNKAPGLSAMSLVVLLLVIMALALCWGLYRDYRLTLDRAESRLQLQVRAFTNAFDMAFVGADHALRELRDEIENSTAPAASLPGLRQMMFRHMLESSYLTSTSFYDTRGDVLVSVGEGTVDSSATTAWLNEMLERRIQSRLSIRDGDLAAAVLVERRGEGPVGVLVTRLDREAVLFQLESGDLYTQQRLLLVDADNHAELISETLEEPALSPQALVSSLPLESFGTRNQMLERDGYLIAIRQMTQQPLRAVATLDTRHVLDSWARRAAVASAVFVILALLSLAFLRYWRKSALREHAISNDLFRLYQAVEQMPSSVLVTDLNSRIIFVNASFLERTGYRMSEVLGQKPSILASGKTPDTTWQSLWQSLTQGLSWEGEFINRMKDGRERIEQQLIAPVQNVDGQISSYISISTDVTEKRDAERRLKRYREIVNVSDELLAMVGVDYTYQQVNRRHEEYLGVTRRRIEGRALQDIYGDKVFEEEIKPFVDRVARGDTVVEEKWVDFAGVGSRFCRVTGKPVLENGDSVETIAVSMVDLTARRESEEALSLSESRFRTLSENLPQGLFEADSDGRILYANRRCGEIFGRELRELADGSWVSSFCGEDRQRILESWDNCIATAQPRWSAKARLLTPQGEERWVALSARRYQGGERIAARYIGTLRDITEETRSRKLLESKNIELARLSTTDMLTGLNNRANIEHLLEKEVHRFERYGSCCAVIMMDVDHFKAVNDTCGHAVGDEVLRRVGSLLGQSTRRSDHAGRWGGEEFLVVCANTSLEGARQLAENLRARIATAAFPVVGEKTCSFGVAAIRPGDSPRELLGRADAALYRAKHAGRNRVDVETLN